MKTREEGTNFEEVFAAWKNTRNSTEYSPYQ